MGESCVDGTQEGCISVSIFPLFESCMFSSLVQLVAIELARETAGLTKVTYSGLPRPV